MRALLRHIFFSLGKIFQPSQRSALVQKRLCYLSPSDLGLQSTKSTRVYIETLGLHTVLQYILPVHPVGIKRTTTAAEQGVYT